ncbi:MAG: 2-hydroxyacyl-CoA dehydratase family protein [Candidatus Hodarchaeota archaeon]
MEKLAYFESTHEFPEEIVMAAGMTPFKIMGDVHKPNDPADQYVQNFICPAARSVLTETLTGAENWAGIIVTHGCDPTNRFFDVMRRHAKSDFIYWFNSPMNRNKTAHKYLKVELKRMVNEIEKKYKVEITDEKIKDAIKISNQIKGLMQQLSKLRAEKDVMNREFYEICLKAVQLPKSEVIALLEKTLDEWKAKPEFPKDKKKILLTGSDITYVEWMDLLEDANLRVVRDDLSLGERYFAVLIPDNPDPLDSLIEYHFKKPRASTKNPPDPRLDYLLGALEETKVDFVVSQNIKFCEVFAFDAVWIQNALKEKGYKVIHLEREFSPTKDRGAITRLEAFAELV